MTIGEPMPRDKKYVSTIQKNTKRLQKYKHIQLDFTSTGLPGSVGEAIAKELSMEGGRMRGLPCQVDA